MGKQVTFEQFIDILNQKDSAIRKNIEKTMKLVCTKVTSDIKSSMSQTPRNTSKSYFTNNKNIPHHPSLPGNPPAPDTGNLRNSIRYEVEVDGSEITGIIGTTQKDPPYGSYLEYGTSKMAPRPWLKPAMEKNKEFIKKNLAQAVIKGLKGGMQ